MNAAAPNAQRALASPHSGESSQPRARASEFECARGKRLVAGSTYLSPPRL